MNNNKIIFTQQEIKTIFNQKKDEIRCSSKIPFSLVKPIYITPLNIPDETLQHLFKYLKLYEVFKLSRVCKKWRQQAFRLPHIFLDAKIPSRELQKICSRLRNLDSFYLNTKHRSFTDKHLHQLLKNNESNISELILVNCPGLRNPSIPNFQLNTFIIRENMFLESFRIANNSRLDRLELDCIFAMDQKSISQALAAASSVTHLKITSAPNINGEFSIPLPHLKELYLSALSNVTSIHTNSRNIHSLQISFCNHLSSRSVTNLLRQQVPLSYVEIQGCPKIENIILSIDSNDDQVPLSQLQCLKLIDLTSFESLSIEFAPYLSHLEVAHCPELSHLRVPTHNGIQHMNISNCQCIPQVQLMETLSLIQNTLKELTLCQFLNELDGLSSLRFQHLTHLKLIDCFYLSNEVFEHLGAVCPSVEQLEISGSAKNLEVLDISVFDSLKHLDTSRCISLSKILLANRDRLCSAQQVMAQDAEASFTRFQNIHDLHLPETEEINGTRYFNVDNDMVINSNQIQANDDVVIFENGDDDDDNDDDNDYENELFNNINSSKNHNNRFSTITTPTKETQLESINITGCFYLTASNLSEILRNSPEIYSLEIRDCHNLREFDLHQNQNLSYIDIQGCSNLSKSFLRYLFKRNHLNIKRN